MDHILSEKVRGRKRMVLWAYNRRNENIQITCNY
jgi:hypothetical protein